MNVIRRPDAVFFDMGGVLLESADRWDSDGFPKSFPEGLPEPAPLDWFLAMSHACIEHFTAVPPPRPAVDLSPLVEEWLKRGRIASAPQDVARWCDILAQWEVRPVYDFVLPTLQALQAMGIRMGVISNTVWKGRRLREHFHRAGILDLFETTVFSADFGVNKPHPAIFRYALDQLGVPPEQAWYVGDKPQRDVCGAHGVGMTAILVDSTHGERVHDAPENRPDLRIPTIAALPDILRRL